MIYLVGRVDTLDVAYRGHPYTQTVTSTTIGVTRSERVKKNGSSRFFYQSNLFDGLRNNIQYYVELLIKIIIISIIFTKICFIYF